MLSIIHYISAGRRLKEADKTIYMMGGPEECNHMLLAQRDMIKLERDFYKEESVQLLLKLSIVFVLILPFFFMGISL